MKHIHGKNILEYVEYECFELEYWGLILGRIIKIFHVVFIKKTLVVIGYFQEYSVFDNLHIWQIGGSMDIELIDPSIN